MVKATPMEKMKKMLATDMKVASPGRKQSRRKPIKYSEVDGPSWSQSNILQRKEEAEREQWAADAAAEENAVARILGEELSWYWERTKKPHCLLAVPVGEDSPNLHWQTMKDPHVSTWPLRPATKKLTECWALIVMDPTQGY